MYGVYKTSLFHLYICKLFLTFNTHCLSVSLYPSLFCLSLFRLQSTFKRSYFKNSLTRSSQSIEFQDFVIKGLNSYLVLVNIFVCNDPGFIHEHCSKVLYNDDDQGPGVKTWPRDFIVDFIQDESCTSRQFKWTEIIK